MKIGYVRVSTIDQNLDLQIDALKAYGCDKIFQDKLSGTKDKRPGLEEALQYVRPGDSLVVWRLDRLGRTMRHLIQIVNELNERLFICNSISVSFLYIIGHYQELLHVYINNDL